MLIFIKIMKYYGRRQFGDPILRKKAKTLSKKEILSDEIKDFIIDLEEVINSKKYGIGLAAPQIGRSLSIAVIDIKPTPTRPNLKKEKLLLINPEIVKYYFGKEPMWEGCISGAELYGMAIRHNKIRLKWQDINGLPNERDFEGLLSQVIQHEVDHLNGILFVDRVIDPRSYVTTSEYKKLIKDKT